MGYVLKCPISIEYLVEVIELPFMDYIEILLRTGETILDVLLNILLNSKSDIVLNWAPAQPKRAYSPNPDA